MKELRKIAEELKKSMYYNYSEVSFKVDRGTNKNEGPHIINYTIGSWSSGPFEADKDAAEKAYSDIAAFIEKKVKEIRVEKGK